MRPFHPTALHSRIHLQSLCSDRSYSGSRESPDTFRDKDGAFLTGFDTTKLAGNLTRSIWNDPLSNALAALGESEPEGDGKIQGKVPMSKITTFCPLSTVL